MFAHILTSLCDVFDDLKNVYLTFCKIEHFILISSFILKRAFCFSEPCYQKRIVFYSDWESYISAHDDICRFGPVAAFVLDTGLCKAGSQQLCIGKFTFVCICVAFYSLAMTTFFQHFACSSLYFYLSHLYSYWQSPMHIVHILYILPCHFLQTKLNLQYTLELMFVRSYTY